MPTRNPFTGRKTRTPRRSNPRLWGRDNPFRLEQLEDRTAPSVNIPLSGTEWRVLGPSPIFAQPGSGQQTSSPGNLPSTGRVTGVAQHPVNTNTLYVSTAGGGVAKSTDSGQTWAHLTDRLPATTLVQETQAPITEAERNQSYGSIAVSPVANAAGEYNVYAGQGELAFTNFSYAGKGILKSSDGGATWTLIQGPGQAFADAAIPKIVVVPKPSPDPNDPVKEIVYAAITASRAFGPATDNGLTKPNGVYRSDDGGATWVNVTTQLYQPIPSGGVGVSPFFSVTDIAVDQTNPDVVYVAVGDPTLFVPGTAYELNGVYKSNNARSANPSWTVTFGGTGTFIPGSKLGRIELALAPSRPSTVYVAVSDPLTSGLLGVWRSQEAGINFRQLATVPNFAQSLSETYFGIAVNPTNEAELVLIGNGPNQVTITGDALNTDPLQVKWQTGKGLTVDAAGEGPHDGLHFVAYDKAGDLLLGTNGGVFRGDLAGSSGAGYSLDWSSLNGVPGLKALNVAQVGGVGIPPSSAESAFAGLRDNGVVGFSDPGNNVLNPNDIYGWPVVNVKTNQVNGNVIYDFVDPRNVYHQTKVSNAIGTSHEVWISNDGGAKWTQGGAPGNANKGIAYAPFEIDPSNRNRLFFGTDKISVSENGGVSWGGTLQGLTIPDLPRVTGLPYVTTGLASDQDQFGVSAIGVSRADSFVLYAAVSDRRKVENNVVISYGPAIYRLNLNLIPAKNEPAWRDITPGTFDVRLPPTDKAPDTAQPNALGFTDVITDISVDPSDPDVVIITISSPSNPGGPRVYRTDDAQVADFLLPPSWTDITGGGATGLPPRGALSVALDPNLLAGPEDDEVYVGTETGVFRLLNPTTGPFEWTRIGGDTLPDVFAKDLDINTSTGILSVGTFGRGVWQLQIRPFISGFTFEDLDGDGFRDFTDNVIKNGKRDPGEAFTEPGFPGVQIITTNLNSNAEQANTTTRPPDGYWEFRSLPDTPNFTDRYRIRPNLTGSLAQLQQTTPPLGNADLLGDPFYDDVTRITNLTNQNIGLFRKTSIQGVKFDDFDGDGTRDPGEPGLQGWVIELLRQDAAGQVVPVLDGAGKPVRLQTLADGSYSFNDLGVIQVVDNSQPGGRRVVPYFVREVPQAGYVRTRPRTTDLIGPVFLTSGTPSVGNDFGNFRVFSLAGIKFEDVNGNGARDKGEPGLPNWVIRLLDETGQPVRDTQNQPIQTLTDANGGYVFNNLAPRYDAAGKVLDYRVREVIQSGWAQITADPPDVPPQSGKALQGGDFGNFQLVTISGSVYDDTNGNGVQDQGEVTPVGGGFAVLVNTGDSSEVDRVPILGDGAFAFPDRRPLIVAGQLVPYTVRLEPATGYVQTSESPAPFTITSGVSVTGLRFGVFKTTSISGQLFHDFNGNGVQDAGEPAGLGVGGGLLVLLRGDDGSVIPGTQQSIGADGRFTIANLGPIIDTPGTSIPYRVRVTGPNGWVITSPNADNPPDQDVVTNNITLVSGVPVGPIAFGGFDLTEISGQVFNDLNGDGFRQAGETGGVAKATVNLIDTRTGAQIATTLTAADGTYVFPDRGPLLSNNINAPYRVEVVAPAGFVLTGTNNVEVLLRSATPAAGKDFAGFKLITVSGKAFNDLNGNGKFELGELVLPGWEVLARNLKTGASATVVTDKTGAYAFPNLGPGVYQIRETVMPGWIQTSPDPADIAAVSGQDIANQLFANFRRIDIGGKVIEDLNRNATFEANEPGRPGFVVNLLDGAGTVIDTRTTDGTGAYLFGGLGPGTYSVRVVLPTSYVRTNPDPAAVTPTSGQNFPDTSFGVLRLGSISSFVYSDNNRNRVQDPREPRLENVQVFLRDSKDEIVRQAVSNKNGEFTFVDLEPGTYKIQFLFGQAGSGFVFSNPDFPNGFPVTITAGTGTPGNEFTQGLGIASTPTVITAADKGGGPHVQVFDALTSQLKSSFFAYDPSFTGGVRVARGDFTGDGVDDYVTVVGPGGGPEVRAFNGVTGELLFSFFAYEPSFTGGMFVAAGDVNQDGVADIYTGTDIGGGPRVQVFDGKTRASIRNYFAYESTFRGGVRVAAGDVNGDGRADIITTPAEGGGPRVTVFDGGDLTVLANFFGFDPTDRAGVYVAAGDFTGDDVAEIVIGQGATRNPLVRIFTATGTQLASAQAFPPDEFGNEFTSEVRVAVTDRLGDGKQDVVITSGPGSITRLRFLDSNLVPSADELRPYTDTFTGGVYVG